MEQVDIAVIGGGAAGLTAAEVAAALGLRVALIEKNKLGGECTWMGCVPSKTLLAAAKVAHTARHADQYGVTVRDVDVDFPAVMARVRRTTEDVAGEESPAVMREKGVQVYEAQARFLSPNTLELSDGRTLRANKFVIATGSSPRIPDGFENIPHLTNETLFDLTQQPEHLLIVGGGPMGTEMGQAFRRLGSDVTIISDRARLLPRDEVEASELIMDTLKSEGVNLVMGKRACKATGRAGDITVTLDDGATVSGTHLLLAVGKDPNVSSLNLEAAGVEMRGGKLVVDDYLRTTQRHIYAAGDASGGAQFSHYAGSQAFQAIYNMVIPVPAKGVKPYVPWTTFTDPEVAHAGLSEEQARQQHGDTVQVTRLPMARADRAMTEGKPQGYMKLVHKPNGKLLGATIVGVNAGEMMNEWVRILDKSGRVWDAALASHIYPTMGSTNAILATEQIRRQVKSGWMGMVLRRLARWRIG